MSDTGVVSAGSRRIGSRCRRMLSGVFTASMLALVCMTPGTALASPPTEEDLAHAKRLLASTILFDGHNDLPWAIRNDKKTPGDIVAYDLRKTVSGETDIPACAKAVWARNSGRCTFPASSRAASYECSSSRLTSCAG